MTLKQAYTAMQRALPELYIPSSQLWRAQFTVWQHYTDVLDLSKLTF